MEANSGKDSGEKVTNLDYLVKLSKGNEQFVREMIRIFLDENPGEIRVLEQAIRDCDFSLINSAAHKLRSTVPFVGIDKIISDEISEIEQLALDKAGDPLAVARPKPDAQRFLPTDSEMLDKIQKLFSHIKTVCSRAYDELKIYA